MTAIPPHDRADGDWDDDRLANAFLVRAAATPPTPGDVADDVLTRLVPARRGLRRWPSLAVAAVAIASIVVLGMPPILQRLQPGATAGNGSASDTPASPGQPANVVLGALGEPITVSQALAIRDAGSGHEIRVTGFLSSMPVLPCPFEPDAGNPTRLVCPETFQWFMERAEVLGTSSPNGFELGRPTGPATQLSFALVTWPTPPTAPDLAADLPAVLLGHFHDRRASLCIGKEACEQTFVVDRVESLGGKEVPVQTQRQTEAAPRDDASVVDGLVAVAAPGAVIVSRQLLPVSQVLKVEPVLKDDQLIPFVEPAKVAWLVTTVDLIDGHPAARTFILLDGSNWFAEISAAGARVLERIGPTPSSSAPIGPTADPSAFRTAPTSLLGIEVRGVGQVNRQRQLDGATDRDEYAIRGWYIAPRPEIHCDPAPLRIHAPEPPCDDARAWLLDDPQVYGIEYGQLRANPDPGPSVLNPLLPVDMAFAVDSSWDGDTPRPQPIIVLGHFNDVRVQAFHGDAYFVVDALAWTSRGPAAAIDSVSRLADASTEDVMAVLARVNDASGHEPVATWATVVSSADFAALNPDPLPPEFQAGPPVWIVRRLIATELFGRQRFAVETAYTADNGTRIWLTPTPDSAADLATHIEIDDLDSDTTLVQVFDYDQVLATASAAPRDGSLRWQKLGPIPDVIEVARGSSSREVAVRWIGTSCDTEWRIDVHEAKDGIIVLEPWRSGEPADCPARPVKREVLFEFNHAIELERIHTGEPCCG
jgi:hypothetical protein